MKSGSSLFAMVVLAGVLAGSAQAIELSERPLYLPPADGQATEGARLLGAQGEELIVSAERGAVASRILRAHGARGLGAGAWLVSGERAAAVVRQLSAAGVLRYAHRNGRRLPNRVSVAQGDPSDPAPWWIPQIGADRVAAPATPGFPLTVVDDGLDVTHPEFAGRPVTFPNANTVVPPEDFHGTMVSSMAVAPANGVGMVGLYPMANLRSVDGGSGTCAESVLALDAAIDAGPSVINMSWGFSPPGCFVLYDVLIQAFGTGSLPVASAGNSRQQGSPPGVPAIWPHVLTVGSTNIGGVVSDFSNRDIGLDLTAPGEDVTLATPVFFNPTGYAVVSGTSFSAPLVAAAASWVATQRPGLELTQFFDLMRLGVRDIAPAGWDPDAGFGILDLPTALTRPVPPVDPLEPNDDVNQVKARGLFREATRPITRPGRGRVSFRARLDFTEDPVDVYRVFVPGKRVVRFRVTTNADVDLELFRPNARTVYYQNRRAALRGALIGGSYKRGRRTETFAVRNSARKGVYLYAALFKAREPTLNADYSLAVNTRKR